MITQRQFDEHQRFLDAQEEIKNSVSARDQEKLIVLFGEGDTGKTSTLKELGKRLGMPSGVLTTENVRVILHPSINGQEKTVFLTTFGDSVTDILNNIRFFNMTPSRFPVYEAKNGKFNLIKRNMPKPDICIGASRVEEMHWILYELYAQIITFKTPNPIMFRKTGIKPNPELGTITQNDKDIIASILNIL